MEFILFISSSLIVPPFILIMFNVLTFGWDEVASKFLNREDYRNINAFKFVNHSISFYSGIGTGFFCAVILSTSKFYEQNSFLGFFIILFILFAYGLMYIKKTTKDSKLSFRDLSLSVLPIATYIAVNANVNIFKVVGTAYLWIIFWWEVSPNSPWYGY